MFTSPRLFFIISLILPGIAGCGQQLALDPPKRFRILGGHSALEGTWPWQVSIQRMWRHICGGSIINHLWIITASHCFKRSNNYKLQVVAGLHSRSKKGKGVQYRSVRQVILHEKFNQSTYDNDVALLRLHHPLHFTNHVQPVCIIENEMQEQQLNFSSCYITGWGSSEYKGNHSRKNNNGSQKYPRTKQQIVVSEVQELAGYKHSSKYLSVCSSEQEMYTGLQQLKGSILVNTLQEAEVQLIDTRICNQRDWYNGHVNDNMICAGFDKGGVDTCQGDSGGPLQCYSEDLERFYLYGVTSHGVGCALPKNPGIYTRASRYTVWLRKAGTRSVSGASITDLSLIKFILALFLSVFSWCE